MILKVLFNLNHSMISAKEIVLSIDSCRSIYMICFTRKMDPLFSAAWESSLNYRKTASERICYLPNKFSQTEGVCHYQREFSQLESSCLLQIFREGWNKWPTFISMWHLQKAVSSSKLGYFTKEWLIVLSQQDWFLPWKNTGYNFGHW